jgi:Chaperone of endosialidase
MAADYTLPPVAEKRTRFFDGQFLTDQDFVDEQKYHLDRQRRHQRLLHVSGICEGLSVRATGANAVTVDPGTAVDPEGRTLALADPVSLDLVAATFNGKSGVTVYIAYQELTTDQQKGRGSADDTRWLERPAVVRLLPDAPWTGATPPVTLAKLSLDSRGVVTVDATVRQYAGVRLPGPAPDAPTLSTLQSGAVAVGGTLSVGGHLGVGTAVPENAENWQRVVDVSGAQNAKLSVRTAAVDARVLANEAGWWGSAPGMIVGTRSAHAVGLATAGATRLTIGALGHVGIATDPKVEPKQDLTVNGRMAVESGVIQRGGDAITTTTDLGLYSQVSAQPVRLVATSGPIRLFTDGGIGTTSRLTVAAAGDVGVGVDDPKAHLDVRGAKDSTTEFALQVRAGNSATKFDSTQVAFGHNGTAQYRHALRSRHSPTTATGNALDFYVWTQSTATGAADTVGGTHVMSLDGGHVGVGTTTAENAEKWTRVVDVLGTTDAKLSVRTGTGSVDGRLMAHDSGIYGSAAGMVVGTKSNHALGLAANGATRLTVTPEGHVGIGSTAPDNAEKWTRVVDVYGGGEPRMSVRATLRTATVEGRVTVVGDEAPRVPGVAEVADVPRMERGMFVGTKTAHALGFMTGGVPQMLVTSDGHLAVGVDNRGLDPDLRLENPDRVDQLVQVYGKAGAMLRVRTEKVQGRIWATETNFPPLPGMPSVTAGMFIGTDNSQPLVLGINRRAALWVNTDSQVVVARDLFVGRLIFQGPGSDWRMIQNRTGGDPVTAAAASAPAVASDARLKTAVRPLTHALRSVLQLTGLRYRWGDEGLDHLTRDVADSVSAGPGADEDAHRSVRDAAVARARAALDGDDIGLLAQDVERVVPEVVHDGPDGYKYIRYGQLTALLVEAVKEQQQTIDRLEARVEALAGGQEH